MANKKCPKCGEDNPAEAVMCWACYTPLTASAGASMGAGIGGAGAATMPRTGGPMGVPGAGVADTGQKKETDPKIFVLGGLLGVGALVALFMTFSGSTPVDPPLVPNTTDVPFPASGPPPPPPLQPVQQGSSGGTGPTNSGTGPSQPPPPSFTFITSPNPTLPTATFAIMPSQSGVSKEQAVNMARTARQQIAGNGKWTRMQIFVFADQASGQAFKEYMRSRRGAPLGSGDYASLAASNSWAGALAFYETAGKSGRVAYPSLNPRSWWPQG